MQSWTRRTLPHVYDLNLKLIVVANNGKLENLTWNCCSVLFKYHNLGSIWHEWRRLVIYTLFLWLVWRLFGLNGINLAGFCNWIVCICALVIYVLLGLLFWWFYFLFFFKNFIIYCLVIVHIEIRIDLEALTYIILP